MKLKRICFTLAVLAFAVTSSPVSALVLFETLPATNTFNSPHYVSLDENTGQVQNSSTDLNWAFQWTPSVSASVTGIDLAISLGDQYTPSDENVAEVYLRTDNAGLPGLVIDSYLFTNLTSETAGGAVESGISSLNPWVTTGTSYWISLSAGLPNNNKYSQVGWHVNDQGVTGAYAREDNNGGWTLSGSSATLAAFRVSGMTAVPEPATLALMGFGLLGMGFSKRKAK